MKKLIRTNKKQFKANEVASPGNLGAAKGSRRRFNRTPTRTRMLEDHSDSIRPYKNFGFEQIGFYGLL